MYRVEMIPKHSVMDDIKEYWIASGREYTAATTGQFIFEDVRSVDSDYAVVEIVLEDGTVFFYNLSDFYRVKIIKTGE